jgi:acetyl esterase
VSLDPELQELIEAWAADPGPPAHEIPVDQARMAHLSETEYLAGEGPAVAGVTDETVAGVPVRVYAPEGARGTIAYLHGGGWVLGTLESVDAVCRALANAAGARVVSIDYRLAPEHPFPAGLDDAVAVTRAVDADVVAGDSAGGNLAAALCLRLRRKGLPLPVGQV